VLNWSIPVKSIKDDFMNAITVIAASEAKAKFSELLERAKNGEGFAITLHGEEVAKLIPARRKSPEEVQAVIAQMKSRRFALNPSGKPKLRIKDLVNEGRP
jgi:prevent-host-death family protein